MYFAPKGSSLTLPAMKRRFPIPQSVAQLTGVLVTGIVTFGTDLDVTYAVPLGLVAGALAVFFVSLSEGEAAVQRAYRERRDRIGRIKPYLEEWR